MTSLSQPKTPPTGEPSFKGPKTCDASAMLEIHRALRRSFGEATVLVDGVAEGDTKHATAVATQLNLISTALHAHHEGEDSRLWDMVSDRAPACVLHVDRMKRQHAGMLTHLEDLDRTLPAWRATATKEAAEPIRSALHGVSAAMAEHFPDEEATIVPAMEHVLAPSEENWFSKHGRAATPKGQLLTKGFDQAFFVGADAAAVPAAAGLALQSIWCANRRAPHRRTRNRAPERSP